MNDTGKVVYADVANESLIRIIKEHDDNFFLGVLVHEIFPDTERLSDRVHESEHHRSKIFGIGERVSSDDVLLLQIGEDGFNDEGVFRVTINRSDLKDRNFANCRFAWLQS